MNKSEEFTSIVVAELVEPVALSPGFSGFIPVSAIFCNPFLKDIGDLVNVNSYPVCNTCF